MFSFLKRDKPQDDAEAARWTSRLREGLAATRTRLSALSALFGAGRRIDETLFEELETVLLSCDAGVEATAYLLERTRELARRERLEDASRLRETLKAVLLELLAPLEQPLDVSRARPFVILMVGVNGAGKTTTIGKLAKLFLSEGRTVLLAAGDTFRAAAREQLEAWGKRSGVSVVSQREGDTAAVVYDAMQSAL
ncbi:MAG: signal recognition particle receptor subunit alpha, partial [bacterium]